MDANEILHWMKHSKDVDDWHRSYEEQKDRHVTFITNEIVKPYFLANDNTTNTKSNSRRSSSTTSNSIHIYESAFGVGRNMAIILDIIEEERQKQLQKQQQQQQQQIHIQKRQKEGKSIETKQCGGERQRVDDHFIAPVQNL